MVTAFAHHIVSTTPSPKTGVVATTPLADTALVYADSTRHIVFFALGAEHVRHAGRHARLHRQRAGDHLGADQQHRRRPRRTSRQRPAFMSGPRRSSSTPMAPSRTDPTACGDEQVTVGPASVRSPRRTRTPTAPRSAPPRRLRERDGLQPDRHCDILDLRTEQRQLRHRRLRVGARELGLSTCRARARPACPQAPATRRRPPERTTGWRPTTATQRTCRPRVAADPRASS